MPTTVNEVPTPRSQTLLVKLMNISLDPDSFSRKAKIHCCII